MIQLRFFYLMVSILLCSCIVQQMSAVPAIPTPVTMMKSDGTKLTVQLYGDEFFHFKKTLDGHLIEEKDGHFYYAVLNEDQRIVCSSTEVHEIGKRTDSEQLFLQTLNKDAIEEALNVEVMESARLRSGLQLKSGRFPSQGEQKALIILVEFDDNSFTIPNSNQAFADMLNGEGYSLNGATGSCRDYFITNSSGKFLPRFDVYGPVKVSKKMSYYGAPNDQGRNDSYPEEMVFEACKLLENIVDFSQYDNDKDGKVDNIYVYYAGYGQADGGHANTIWPHSSNIESFNLVLDGVLMSTYACSAELKGGTGSTMCGIGTFTHEFMHVLGLPDLYETNYNKKGCFTPGKWSVLDVGNYNNEQHTPPYMSAYERYALGWLEPQEPTDPANMILNTIDNNTAYIVKTDNPNEYFLFENRQQKGWDTYIPGHGMLVWHIDYDESLWSTNRVNNDPDHQHADIIEADNIQSIGSIEGDAFPGTSKNRSFTGSSTPAMKTWLGTVIDKPITDIIEEEGIIGFRFRGGKDLTGKAEAFPAKEITQTGFTAQWKENTEASHYLLNVFKVNEDGSLSSVVGFVKKKVENVTSYAVEGLDPESNYVYSVIAADLFSETEVSDLVAVRTLNATFEFYIPEAKAALNVKAASFEAHWNELKEANSYILNVYRKKYTDPEGTETVDFTGRIGGIPQGWSTDCTSVFSGEGYYGEASPALRMDIHGQYLESPLYEKSVSSFSFWYRANAVSSNSLEVLAFDGDRWVNIRTVTPLSNEAGGEAISLDPEELKGYYAVSVKLNKTGTGAVALDDVALSYGSEIIIEPADGYKELEAGNVLSYEVNGLESNNVYYYTITGSNGTVFSKTSNEIKVELKSDTNIEETAENGYEIKVSDHVISIRTDKVVNQQTTIYNIMGYKVYSDSFIGEITIPVSRFSPGIYLLKINQYTHKIIIR